MEFCPMRQHVFGIALFAALLPFGAAAQPLIQSQEGIALENQILQLQQQVQQLQAGGSGGSALGNSQPAPAPSDGSGGAPSSIVANLLTQVQQLQSQVQQLNGEVDTLQNQVNTQHDQTEKEIGDLNFKVTGGASPGGASPGGAAPGTPATPGAPGAPLNATAPALPPPVTPPPIASTSPKAALHAAQEAIVRGNYAAAETNARAVLATAKSSSEGYQAQYILAQSLYGEGRPQEAAIAFDDAYNRNKDGDYAPGALLGLANSLSAIHQDAAACDTLASLNSQFPSPPKGLQSGIDAASRRAHCS
jgi:TolA-binding protein